MAKNRIAALSGAAIAIVAGLGLIVFALVPVVSQQPTQDPPIRLQASKPPSASPKSEPSFAATISESITVTSSSSLVRYGARPKLNEKIGTITFPTLEMSWPIFEGTEEAQLAKGVGHYVNSVLPGIADNSVLSGHRTTVFNRLGELKVDDLILVKTRAGTFTYQVQNFRVVDRDDRTVIVPTEDAVLTLTTCYPFNHIGATTDAFVVSAKLVEAQIAQ